LNIIIAGAGKVGFNLAKTLLIGHNVTVIDKNIKAVDRIQEGLDILALQGDVEDYATYMKIRNKKVDLFIAVTNIDNVNLVSTLVADFVLDIERKFIRLHNHFYEDKKIADKLKIEKIIFPRKLISHTIVSLLKYPKANNVKTFKYTPYKLVSIRAFSKMIPFILQPHNFTIVGIERENSFFIPKGEHIEIKPNDLVYIFGLDEAIKQICTKLEPHQANDIKKCVVFGGGELGITIARALIETG